MLKRLLLLLLTVMMLAPSDLTSQSRLPRILVGSPAIESKTILPIADVIAGSLIREMRRNGGVDIVDRQEAEKYIQSQGGDGWIGTREQADDAARALGADIVMYTVLSRNDMFVNYIISFYEVRSGIVQRQMKGNFRINESAQGISHIMEQEFKKVQTYIPLPSDLEDPGAAIRDASIDPDKLPKSHEIENIAVAGLYGYLEQVLNYYRVFPGEQEYQYVQTGLLVSQFSLRDETFDEELQKRYNKYNAMGFFAKRYDLQAYFIRDCSTQALNVLIANNIPVFFRDDLLTGYHELMSDGFCLFATSGGLIVDVGEITMRDLQVILFIVPKPGRKGGISRDYLESAIGRYSNEQGESPTLVDVTSGIFDVPPGVNE